MEQSSCEATVEIIQTYPDLARELVKMISSAQREIYIAPRFYEPAIGSRMISKVAEGVSIHMLDANPSAVAFEKRLRAAGTHDLKTRELISKFLDQPNSVVQVKRLDYSFLVVDGHSCGIEIVNPTNPDDFFCAIKLESASLAKELITIFHSLANTGETPMQNEGPRAES